MGSNTINVKMSVGLSLNLPRGVIADEHYKQADKWLEEVADQPLDLALRRAFIADRLDWWGGTGADDDLERFEWAAFYGCGWVTLGWRIEESYAFSDAYFI